MYAYEELATLLLTSRKMSYIGRILNIFAPRSARLICLRSELNLKKIMSSSVEEVQANNQRNKALIATLEKTLIELRKAKVEQHKVKLLEENTKLRRQVETAKAQLIALEVSHGKKQIQVPNATRACSTNAPQQAENASGTVKEAAVTEGTQQKPAKEKKPKKEKPQAAAGTTTAVAELPIDVGRLDMRIGKILEVNRHPDADSLYVEKIDCGEAQPRTVVSGLVKYVPIEEMQNRLVVVLCNLKPAKMRGITSEAMVMCASTPDRVEVLAPPANAVAGDLVHCEGYARQPDIQLNPKKKIFETCAPDLMTNNEFVACYKGAVLHVPGKGNIVAKTLNNVNVK